MAGLADTLRGDGLARAQRALAGLEGDPLRLDRERQRFSHSPPPYTSNPSGTTTRSASSIPPSEERRQQRRMQLAAEREASEPRKQFSAQVEEERRRIWDADPSTSWRELTLAELYTFKEEACETVKKRWVEQGIWNNKWNKFASGRWKHEEPLELESESETNSEEEPSPQFSLFAKEPQRKPRRPKSDKEKRQIAERRVMREREHEASRPYNQFVYQIRTEGERIQGKSTSGEGTGVGLPDINTKAYENVKNTWIKRGIWNKIWGILPGMSWKHEEPFEEIAESLTPQANPVENGSHGMGEAPFGNILGRPVTNLPESGILIRSPFPVESSHDQASCVMTTSQQVPPADIDSAGLDNDDAGSPHSAPNSPRPRRGNRILRPTTGQASRPRRRKQPEKDEHPQPMASASLGPVCPSKISKAAGKRKPMRQRRLNFSQEVASGSLPLSSEMDVVELQPPQDYITPRRSKRIQPPVPSIVKDSAKTAPTNPSRRAVRSRPERKVASNLMTRSPARRQGVSKRQPAKTARGKLGKK